MNPTHHHACMAHFEEPVFCSHDVATLLASYSSTFVDHSGSGTASAQTSDVVEDDDESDAGGVLLPEHDIDQQMTDALASTNISGYPACLGVRCQGGSSSNPQAHQLSTILGSSHPRPHSQEMWEEENSRRVRFALDGEDTGEVPQYDIRSEQRASPIDVSHTEGHMGIEATHSIRRSSWGSAPEEAADDSHQTTYHQTQLNDSEAPNLTSFTPLPTERDSGNGNGHGHAFLPTTTDNHMEVDDPRWSYDFAEFMDTWRFRSLVDKSVPQFDPGIQPSVRIGRNLDEVRSEDIASREVDIQGLHWQLLGPSRECALAARASMHPLQHQPGILQGSQCDSEIQAPAYRFRNFTTKHQARFSHYQLRNVLAATSRSDIFYADGSKVYRTALAGGSTQDTVMDFSRVALPAAAFRITCLSASSRHNILVAGGFNGEFAMLSSLPRTGTSALTKGFLTRAFNGLVTHIQTFDDRRSGLPQAAFCSNDQHVRLMDLGTARLVGSHAYSHPVNCSATAPDGRLRVLVGDSNDAHITDAEKGNVIATLHGHTDHGFACSWAQNGLHLATGAQDGKTLVWDARNWSRPLHTLPSTMSCPRSLHFTDNDGLTVAEDEDVVSVYDPSTFAKRQDIHFFGSIAGVALLDGGDELALANSDKTVGGLMSFQRTVRGGEQEQRPLRFDKGLRQSFARAHRSLDLLSNVMV
ncbi:WD40 repeat-like protein [Hortaea werneckii]|uniref:Uncharacterized protein n=1 Tax=Hortaea werneckii TaxID=91943 RepID=A0A3M7EAW8_HORWE|nr:WD40 repeat-like protein [Hortaea werneckii]KAI7345576.1 WD40 repeat-like protein [Hortaea werneckii]KAI7560471.1 WD40 repeat-like protein [Hortaea werneckii]KAI7608290.1 WD40 repeat-like protein [Hortaea werneckii]KAI7616063.1 WD40 repeat-like protein [Hortaea werneckii]